MDLRWCLPLVVVAAAASPLAAWNGAGLSEPFQYPDNPTPGGTLRSVITYGATSGDTSDDSDDFNEAITASSAGDTVYIPNGTYRLNNTVNLKAGVSLIGESRDGVVLATNFSSVKAAIVSAAGVGNLTISDFTLRKAAGSGIKEGIRIGAAGSTTVTSKVLIEHVVVRDFDEKGISLRSTKHCLVRYCVVGDAVKFDGGGEGYGIELAGKSDLSIDYSSTSNNNWITNNEVRRIVSSTHPNAVRHGILLQYWSNHNLVEGNLVQEASQDAFDLHGENEHHNELRFNVVIDCERAGFGLGNPCSTGCGHDDTGEYNWLHNNVVTLSQTGVDIMLGTSNTLVEKNTFNNFVSSTGTTRGILIRDVSAVNASDKNANNVLSANIIHGAQRGIEIKNAPGTIIEGNRLYDNSTFGVYVVSDCAGWRLRDNYIACNGTNISFGSNTPAENTNNNTTCATVQTLELTSTSTYDGDVRQGTEGGSTGAATSDGNTIRVGDSTADTSYRGVVSFRTQDLPDNAIITGVRLQMWRSSITGTPLDGTLGQQVVDIGMPKLGNSQNLQTSDWEAAVSVAAAGILRAPDSAGLSEIALPAGVLGNFDKTLPTQLKLRYTIDDNDNSAEDFVRWVSGNSTTTSKHPRLIVTYTQ